MKKTLDIKKSLRHRIGNRRPTVYKSKAIKTKEDLNKHECVKAILPLARSVKF
jgi:hypothetical protein